MAKIKDNLTNLLQLKNSTDESADLYFYGDIVSSWWGTWDDTDQYPDSVKRFLANAKGKHLNIHINSGGGSVFAGVAIYNMIKHHEGTTTTYVDGIAASIASVIALASDKLVMRTGSMMMIHKPLLTLCGAYNATDLEDMVKNLNAVQECIIQVYRENMKDGVDISNIEKLVNSETYMPFSEVEKYFNVTIEDIPAVACTSEYMDKYLPKNQALENKKQEVLKARAEFELLKMKGVNNGTTNLFK